MMKPHRKWAFMSLAISVLIAASETKLLSFVKDFIDEALIPKNWELIILVALSVAVLMAVNLFARFYQKYFMRITIERSIRDIRKKTLDRYLVLSKSKLQSVSAGDINNNIFADIFTLTQANHFLSDVVREPLLIIFFLSYLFFLHWKLTLICFFAIPLIVLVARYLGKSSRKTQDQIQGSLQTISQQISEGVDGFETAHIFNQGPWLRQKYHQQVDQSYDFLIKLAKIEELVSPLTKLITSLIAACLLLLGGYFVVTGELSTGELFGFMTTAAVLQQPIRHLNNIHVRFNSLLAGAERIYKIQQAEQDSISQAQAYCLENELQDEAIQFESLELKQVDYAYPNSHQKQISDISFQVKALQKIAFVGKSGAGKSTIMQLLLRFYDPSEGEYLLNNKKSKDLAISRLRSYFSYVSQHPFLFSMSLKENIMIANKEASEKDFWQAVEQAGIQELIDNLENKENTKVGPQFKNQFSGGEIQRLSLARAFLSRAPILILDEPTANIDAIQENKFFAALEALKKQKTVLMIAHQFRHLKAFDKIYVLQAGKIVESGSYQELNQSQEGLFSKLLNQQHVESHL